MYAPSPDILDYLPQPMRLTTTEDKVLAIRAAPYTCPYEDQRGTGKSGCELASA